MKQRDFFKYLWVLGAVLVAVGEAVTAFDKRRGNTISETYARLPDPSRALVLVAIGAVLGHWTWPMPAPVVVIEGAIEEAEIHA